MIPAKTIGGSKVIVTGWYNKKLKHIWINKGFDTHIPLESVIMTEDLKKFLYGTNNSNPKPR